jgi:hypothetical protein
MHLLLRYNGTIISFFRAHFNNVCPEGKSLVLDESDDLFVIACFQAPARTMTMQTTSNEDHLVS